MISVRFLKEVDCKEGLFLKWISNKYQCVRSFQFYAVLTPKDLLQHFLQIFKRVIFEDS